MSVMDNFRQAAKELFGLERPEGEQVGTGDQTDGRGQSGPVTSRFDDTPSGALAQGAPKQAQRPDFSALAAMAAGDTETGAGAVKLAQQRAGKETSVIAKGTLIVGQIKTDGHLEVMGGVEGDIEAEGNILIKGKVTGNITGQQLDLVSCRIKGNLHAATGISVSQESIVIGDVETQSIDFDGKLKGNLNVSSTAVFKKSAYLLGDIAAQSLSIETGAVINGQVKTLAGQHEDDLFDHI